MFSRLRAVTCAAVLIAPVPAFAQYAQMTETEAVASRLNIDLPRGWAAQASYSMTRDQNWVNTTGTVNKNAVSAALGWTMLAAVGSGTLQIGVPSFYVPAEQLRGPVSLLEIFERRIDVVREVALG